MKKHQFTLVLAGISELTSDLADALYTATQGDIELNMRDRVAYLEFERSSPTLQRAITSAIKDVENAKVGVKVIRVETDAANTIAKINAELLGSVD
ncbi:MAG TPA: hypothetical protein VMV69_10145 [Pirellulales bacterium]|nr:hypothetical protein [Pirellulales bacterium]